MVYTIPKIGRMELYVNKYHRTITDIKADSKCDYIINAGVYDPDAFKPKYYIKANGVVYTIGNDSKLGFAWSDFDTVPTITDNYRGFKNYLSYYMLISNKEKIDLDSKLAESDKFSAIGFSSDGSCTLCISTDDDIHTVGECQNVLFDNIKCEYAMLMSSDVVPECCTKDKLYISDESIYSDIYLLIWKDDNVDPIDYDSIYSIYVGGYLKDVNAQRLRLELSMNGYPGYVTFINNYYRVHIGNYSEYNIMTNIKNDLSGKGYSVSVITRRLK